MEPQIEKAELMEWLSTVEDQNILDMVAEVKAKYSTRPDFETRWKEGITGEEFRKKLLDHIDTLPWKK